MKAIRYLLPVLIVGIAAPHALAQGGCMRGASPSSSMGSMMSPMSSGFGNSQSTYLQQMQLAYQYQLQQTQWQQQLQLEQAALKLQSDQAVRKAALREQRLAARRERQESEKARRAAAKVNAMTKTAGQSKQFAASR